MKLHVFVAMIVCLAIALLPPISSKKVFSQNALPLAEKALTLPAGYTIPPQDKPCILPGNKVDIQCLIRNDPDLPAYAPKKRGSRRKPWSRQNREVLIPFTQSKLSASWRSSIPICRSTAI
jgi:hypothetical protein